MIRQLHVQNGVAVGEWKGEGDPPVMPEGWETEWEFVDVTDNPDAQIGDEYVDGEFVRPELKEPTETTHRKRKRKTRR